MLDCAGVVGRDRAGMVAKESAGLLGKDSTGFLGKDSAGFLGRDCAGWFGSECAHSFNKECSGVLAGNPLDTRHTLNEMLASSSEATTFLEHKYPLPIPSESALESNMNNN